jgi:signal transduction histidine kinase
VYVKATFLQFYFVLLLSAKEKDALGIISDIPAWCRQIFIEDASDRSPVFSLFSEPADPCLTFSAIFLLLLKINLPFGYLIWLIILVLLPVMALLYRRNLLLKEHIRAEKILNYFATSLYGKNTVEDIFWDIAKNCISELKLEDCVIYQYDEQRKVLVQKAAFGPKNPGKHEIMNPIEIPLGKGIVGSVAASGRPEIVSDVTKDSRYIIDDEQRFSEISVPVFVEGKLFGVIDSEHHRKHFFSKHHLALLEKISLICSTKISKYLAEEQLRVKIARDLHDEVGSTLTSIHIISKMALQQVAEQSEVHHNLKKIREYSARTMESMSDMVWAINPLNDSVEKIIIRMKEFAAEMLEPAQINYCFHEEGSLNEVKLNLEQRKDFFLIFKEAVNNAVKYSDATELNIWMRREDSLLKMQVTDNGKGFNIVKSSSGNGLKNMQSRAEQMKAELHILSIPETGTTIAVQLDPKGT